MPMFSHKVKKVMCIVDAVLNECNVKDVKNPSSASLVPRYILRLGQRGCFSAAYPNRKMHLDIRGVDEGLFNHLKKYFFNYILLNDIFALQYCN